ncbi:MAG: DUF2541 domain-containing protein [Hyphomicrobiaceae bacterium]|nr:DUF2541 domain-containing protein [Hyphomicrobiaceae bacterium]
MKRRLIVASAALISALATTAVQAQDLNLLGSKNVVLSRDTETIDLTTAKGQVQGLRIYAKRRGIEISNVEVTYSDGTVHNERRSINLLEGERTREIDRRNNGKFVDRVTVTFKPQQGAIVPSLLEVYGVQTEAMARAARAVGSAAPASASVATPSAAPAATTGVVPARPTAAAPTPANPGQTTDTGEVLFGTQQVGFGVDRDVIRVGADIGKFDKIALRVLDNDIFINSLKVVYANGESEEIAYNAEIKKNTRTRYLALKGDRFIKEIQLVYRSRANFRGQAYVEVFGQFAEGWVGQQGEGRKFNQGYLLLGGQTAGFTIDRNDVIKVGRNDGGFRKIQVRVRDQAITLFEVRVVYGNGEVDIIPANRTKIDAGSTFGPIDLKGGTRIISEIRPTYRTRIFQQGGVAKGRAVVEFWGQH